MNGPSIFANGAFTPLAADEDFGDDEWFKRNDFSCSQSFGNTNGWHFTLYESGEREWVVRVGTAGHYHEIQVKTWPDLIALMAMLGPSVIAGCFEEGRYGVPYLQVAERDEKR